MGQVLAYLSELKGGSANRAFPTGDALMASGQRPTTIAFRYPGQGAISLPETHRPETPVVAGLMLIGALP